MGLYSEMLDQERILRSLEGAKQILLITCPGCACESLSYTEGLPNRSLKEEKDMEASAIAVHQVRDRWDEALRAQGKTVRHLSIAFPCEMTDKDCAKVRQALQENDHVAVLACSSGYLGIRDLLKEQFSGKVVPMMKTSGTFVFRLENEPQGRYNKVAREGARLVRFSENEAVGKV